MASATTTTTTTAAQSAPRASGATLRLSSDFNELNRETKRTRRIVYPATKEAQRRWQLEQMAAAFRIFAKLGFADGSSGHISLRGSDGHLSLYLSLFRGYAG